jgi:CheY-like chemotaxis protein
MKESKTALVVDDEDIVRDYYAAVLSTMGLRVLTADDGDTAIAVLEKNPEVDLLVLDLKMKRMSGKEAYKLLKQIKPDMKVIVSSAYITSSEGKQLQEMGVDAILKKPFPMLSFRETVLNTLGD